MFLITCPNDFNKNYLMLAEKTKNNIMGGGSFYRLFYSDELGTSKGLFLGFKLKNISIEKYFNKLKCSFEKKSNGNIIEFIKMVEKQILDINPDKHNKTPVYRIEEQLQNEYIKIFYNNQQPLQQLQQLQQGTNEANLLLKISGIWTSNNEYGATFRFFFIRQ